MGIDSTSWDLYADLMNSPPTLLLTTTEAADELRVSRAYIHILMRDGRLPSIKIGAARRIRRSDLERLIANSTGDPAA